MTNSQKTILVADDSALMRTGLKAICNDTEFQIVKELESAIGLFDEIQKIKPDIVVLDIIMPGAIGAFGLASMLRGLDKSKLGYQPRIIVWSVEWTPIRIQTCLDHKVRVCIDKTQPIDQILLALNSPENSFFLPLSIEAISGNNVWWQKISSTKKNILILLLRGKGTKEIAEELHHSPEFIQKVISEMLKLAEAGDRAALIMKAWEAGFRPNDKLWDK